MPPLPLLPLPIGVRSRTVPGINGLAVHLLEAGFETPGRPLVLLLHGFPELAFSWRHVLPALAAAGFHAIAPDQRGYGRTTGWDARYDGDVGSFRMLNLARDALGLVMALGYRQVHAVVGHDFGSPVAAWCAVVRPDVFQRVVLMSAPFAGPPALPFNTADRPAAAKPVDVHAALAALPRPRKHYQWHYATPGANAELPHMPTPAQIAANRWLPDAALRVYSSEYTRTGFQGGLNWYRCSIGEVYQAELQLFAGRRIEVPALYLAGRSDWGTYQKPGGFEALQAGVC
ncbi:MAG: alpha/beta hydrolase, partial [Burkholderiales bacterium PBB5]